MTMFHIECADCLEAMPQLEADSIDSIVTDPPYGLSFMGKADVIEGFNFIGIERDDAYAEIAQKRCEAAIA